MSLHYALLGVRLFHLQTLYSKEKNVINKYSSLFTKEENADRNVLKNRDNKE